MCKKDLAFCRLGCRRDRWSFPRLREKKSKRQNCWLELARKMVLVRICGEWNMPWCIGGVAVVVVGSDVLFYHMLRQLGV